MFPEGAQILGGDSMSDGFSDGHVSVAPTELDAPLGLDLPYGGQYKPVIYGVLRGV